jgi:rod shape-determining protein MreD
LAIITVILAVAQTTVPSWMQFHGAVPSLLFIAAISYGFRWPMVEAGIAGWVLGMVADITSANPIGGQGLGFALSAIAANRLRSILTADNPIAQLLTVGILGWLTFSGVRIYERLVSLGLRGWSLGSCIQWGAWTAGYTALLTPYLFWILNRIPPLLGLRVEGKRR